MDKAKFLERRTGRYMAQVLEKFEEIIEPHLDDTAKADVKEFKALVRQRLNALERDATDLFELGNGAVNGAAQEMRDRLSPTGRP